MHDETLFLFTKLYSLYSSSNCLDEDLVELNNEQVLEDGP